MKKHITPLLCLLAFTAFSASAQSTQPDSPAASSAPAATPATASTTPDANALAAALEMMKVTRSDEMFKQMLPILSKNMSSILMKNNPQKEAQINKLIDEYYVPEFVARLGELQSQVAIIYASNFTTEDMQQITAFYKTPIGQKYLQMAPSIVAQSLPITRVWAQEVAHDATRKLLEQLKQNNMNAPKGMGL